MPRINRHEPLRIEEGDSQLWAVSYSDLLMVLLSFFAVYFSFDTPSAANKGVLTIAMSMQGKGFSEVRAPASTGANGAADRGGPAAGAPGGPDADRLARTVPKGLGDLFTSANAELAGKHVVLESTDKSFIVYLEPDIFDRGGFSLTPDIEKRLHDVLQALLPYKERIEVTVIGHTDVQKLSRRRNQYVTNNFDLSSMRALKALQFMLHEGFPPDQISAQGSAGNLRSSRTLSLRIQLRGRLS
jgi:flagellar motor protein MotB